MASERTGFLYAAGKDVSAIETLAEDGYDAITIEVDAGYLHDAEDC